MIWLFVVDFLFGWPLKPGEANVTCYFSLVGQDPGLRSILSCKCFLLLSRWRCFCFFFLLPGFLILCWPQVPSPFLMNLQLESQGRTYLGKKCPGVLELNLTWEISMGPNPEAEQMPREAVGFQATEMLIPGHGCWSLPGCLAGALMCHSQGEATPLPGCFLKGLHRLRSLPPWYTSPLPWLCVGITTLSHQCLTCSSPFLVLHQRYRGTEQAQWWGNKMAFGTISSGRGVGFRWEIAGPAFIDWVNMRRWCTFHPSEWKDAGGLAGTGTCNEDLSLNRFTEKRKASAAYKWSTCRFERKKETEASILIIVFFFFSCAFSIVLGGTIKGWAFLLSMKIPRTFFFGHFCGYVASAEW